MIPASLRRCPPAAAAPLDPAVRFAMIAAKSCPQREITRRDGLAGRPMGDIDRANDSEPITGLLARWGGGDGAALQELMPIVYAELHRLARSSMRRERADHTLQTTALVHETYLRLARSIPPELENRGHFFALMARLMRRVLVDHARGVRAGRRGGGALKLPLDGVRLSEDRPLTDLIALDEALEALRAIDERKAKTIELRFFAGLEVKETAAILEVSVPTVVNDTRMARAWLYSWIHRNAAP